jgi:DNA-binding MarR family transcriptional regulator
VQGGDHAVIVRRPVGGPSTQRELADALRVSPRNITGLVDALVETGFVSREPHPTDRRATLVQFAQRGADVAGELERDQQEFARVLFEGMPEAQIVELSFFADDPRALVAHARAVLAPQERRDR